MYIDIYIHIHILCYIILYHIILYDIVILAIFYPPLKYIWGCIVLFLQTRKGNIYFTEWAERAEYGKYDSYIVIAKVKAKHQKLYCHTSFH